MKDGQCLKCKAPLLIDTMRMRPLCSDCEREINEKITKSMKERGKPVKGKSLVFPKKPKNED